MQPEADEEKIYIESIRRRLCLPANLNDQTVLFAETYDRTTGGYRAPVRDRMPRLSKQLVESFKAFGDTIHPNSNPHIAQHAYDSVELEVAQHLYSLARLSSAKTILETGTSRGLSTCFLAAAVNGISGGQVVTIDPAQEVPHLWDGSNLENIIKWISLKSTECLDIIRAFLSGAMFDILFLDSFHTYFNVISEISIFEPMLRVGGFIILHDTLFYDGLGAAAHQMSMHPRYECSTLPTPRSHGISDCRCPGITICRKVSADHASFPVLPMTEYLNLFPRDQQTSCLGGRTISDTPLFHILESRRRLGLIG